MLHSLVLVPWLKISTLIKLCSELLVLVCCNLSVSFCTHFHSFSVQLCEINSKMFPALPQSLALAASYTKSCLKNVLLISPPRGTLVQSCQGCPSWPVHPSHSTGWAYRCYMRSVNMISIQEQQEWCNTRVLSATSNITGMIRQKEKWQSEVEKMYLKITTLKYK